MKKLHKHFNVMVFKLCTLIVFGLFVYAIIFVEFPLFVKWIMGFAAFLSFVLFML